MATRLLLSMLVTTLLPGGLLAPAAAGTAPGAPAGPTPADIRVCRALMPRYRRTQSRVMLRLVERPTRACLDFAAYDRNNLMHDPAAPPLAAPAARPRLADLTFEGALVPMSLKSTLAETPLTEAEKRSPLAMVPLLDYLAVWNYDASEKLMLAAARVSEHKWGGAAAGRPLQRMATGYLHAVPGRTELWVRIEFEPSVTFVEGLADEDGDGYREAYGCVDRAALTPAVAARIRTDYMGRVLTDKQVQTYFYELTSAWYRALNTFLLKPNEMHPWPNAATEPEVRAEMAGHVLERPTAVIRGKPHGTMLYNVFLVTGASTTPAGERTPKAPGRPRPR